MDGLTDSPPKSIYGDKLVTKIFPSLHLGDKSAAMKKLPSHDLRIDRCHAVTTWGRRKSRKRWRKRRRKRKRIKEKGDGKR